MKQVFTALLCMVALFVACSKNNDTSTTTTDDNPPPTNNTPKKNPNILTRITFDHPGIINEKDTAKSHVWSMIFETETGVTYFYDEQSSTATGGNTADYVGKVNLVDTLGTPSPNSNRYDYWSWFFPVTAKAADTAAFNLQLNDGKTQNFYVTTKTQIIAELDSVPFKFMANWYNKELYRLRGKRWKLYQN